VFGLSKSPTLSPVAACAAGSVTSRSEATSGDGSAHPGASPLGLDPA